MRHFLKTHKGVKVELKHTRGSDYFPFSELPAHQLDDLASFDDGAPFVHKFDDAGYRKKPCDFIGVAGGYSFVAIRYPKFVAILSFNVYRNEAESGTRKSLTSERAQKVAYNLIKI